jgi:hypothetical protein
MCYIDRAAININREQESQQQCKNKLGVKEAFLCSFEATFFFLRQHRASLQKESNLQHEVRDDRCVMYLCC